MDLLVFETALGHTALAREHNRLHGLSFGHANQQAAFRALGRALTAGSKNPQIITFADAIIMGPGEDELVDRLRGFAAGELTSFDDLLIDVSHLTPFGQKVTAACRSIPWGETRTYGQLAKQAGRPGAARAVGSVMARNRVPLIVPCHRVVPAGGGLGGFSAPQGVAMKRRLLDLEQTCGPVLAH